MVFLGSSKEKAKDQMISSESANQLNVTLQKMLGGNIKLIFPLKLTQTWRELAWALDQLDVTVEDRDIHEGSFYIYRSNPSNRNLLDKLFGKDAVQQTYQLLLKREGANQTAVLFNSLEGGNTKQDLEYAEVFLTQIVNLFKQ